MAPLALIVLRVCAVYLFLLVLVRLAGKREVGQLSPMEFLCVLLLSETVSPALTGGDHGVPAAMVAAFTLMALSILVNVLAFRSRWVEELTEGRPELLIRSGRIDRRVMRRERITRTELEAALRRHGLDSVERVARAYVETNGDITVLKADGESSRA
jgi:uncharacterized membrane protein YcaP (DUF421 family)